MLKQRKRGLVLLASLVCTVCLLCSCGTENHSTSSSSSDSSSSAIESEGSTSTSSDVSSENSEEASEDEITTEKVQTETGAILEGNLAKEVKQFRTLADAEADMGYYLGLHNTLESVDGYELVGFYKIDGGTWYQAVYEYETPEEIGYPTITIKTSKTATLDELVEPYTFKELDGTGGKVEESKKLSDVLVNYAGYQNHTENGFWDLAYFEVPNGKKYSIYSSSGINKAVLDDILNELIGNLKIMEDWKEND